MNSFMGKYYETRPISIFYNQSANRQGSTEKKASITLAAHKSVDVDIIYLCTPPPERLGEETSLAQPALMRGLVHFLI